MAAAIAYWMLLSLFPLTLAAMSIIGFLYPSAEDQARIIERIANFVPVSGDYLADAVDSVVGARRVLGLLAIVGLLFSGAKVFAAIRRGINQAWQIREHHSFMLARAIDLIMLLGTVFLIIIAVVFSTSVSGFSLFGGRLGGVVGLAIVALREVLLLAFTFGVLLLLYRYIPNTRVAWRAPLLGALVGTILLLGVRLGFIWFVARFDSFNIIYGSLGALIAVLAWAYFSSMAMMWGAQVAATHNHLWGPEAKTGGHPDPGG